MSAISALLCKSLLDWCLLGASPTRPSAIWVACCTGTPNNTAASEIGQGSGYTRARASFAPASDGKAVNINRLDYGPFSSACAIVGLALFDQQAGGSFLWGTAIAPYAVLPGQDISAAAGSLSITLS